MKYIANSKFTYAGKEYLPGEALPKASDETVAEWLKIGYAVLDKSFPRKGKAKDAEDDVK